MILDHELKESKTRDSNVEVEPLLPDGVEAVVGDGVRFALVLDRLPLGGTVVLGPEDHKDKVKFRNNPETIL
jgi:hypothetical protein